MEQRKGNQCECEAEEQFTESQETQTFSLLGVLTVVWP